MSTRRASPSGPAKDKVRHLLQGMNPDPVLVRDGNGKIIYTNVAFDRLFDYRDESAKGRKDHEVLPGELLEVLSVVDREVWATGSLVEHQYDVQRDETEHSYLIRAFRDESPEADLTCTIFRDISDRIESVRQMELLKEQAEAASLIKSRFLANMSHELRTPLNSIIGYSELLLENETLEREQSDDISRIRRAGADLLQLVDEVLDFSRLESSEADVYYQPIEVGEFIQDLQAAIEPMVTRRGNELVLDIERAPTVIRTDLTKLEKILLALLNNACKFTHNGTITLAVDYTGTGPETWISFSVTDTGIGIPSSELMAIFDPFRQIDESSTRNYSGSGLGLNISRQFSELLGGGIQVTSTPGKGSTFTLSIPDMGEEAAAAQEENAVGSYAIPMPASDQPIALVIEDNPEASDLISRHLVRQGCRVVAAMDGITGKEMAVDLSPDIITLALEMQFVDGWTVLQHLKTDARTRDIPVIICSHIDERKLGFEQGVAGYLLKPVAASAVQELLAEIPGS